MNDEWPEGRIEYTPVNAANLTRLHVGVVQAMQAVDWETCTTVVIPGASAEEASRALRMVVDGDAAKAERERIVAWLRTHPSIAAYRLTDEEYPSPETLADMIERGVHMEEK